VLGVWHDKGRDFDFVLQVKNSLILLCFGFDFALQVKINVIALFILP
jgi:hypothetical protein